MSIVSHNIRGVIASSIIAVAFVVSPDECWLAATEPNQPATSSQRFDYHTVRGRNPIVARNGRYEGETAFALGGRARAQGLTHYGEQWSRGSHLLWDGRIGDSYRTPIHVEASGVYDVAIQLTAAPDYGIFEIDVAEHKVAYPIDLYGSKVDLAPLVVLEDVQLSKGMQQLVFTLKGSNPKARKFKDGYLLGVDFVQLNRKDKPPSTPSNGSTTTKTRDKSSLSSTQLAFTELKTAMNSFCVRCHGGGSTDGDLDLTAFTRRNAFLSDIEATRSIRDAVANHEMPPEDNKQPSKRLRSQIVASFDGVIAEYLSRDLSLAPVVMRRLNRYEYSNAVRDLLNLRGDIYPLPEKTIRPGHDYFDPASGQFPETVVVGNRTLGKNQVERQILTGVSPFAIDLQAEGGFNNRGRDLSVSPLLLQSFLKLGRSIVHSPEFDDYCKDPASLFIAPTQLNSAQEAALAQSRLSVLLEAAFRTKTDHATLNRYHKFFINRLNETQSFQNSMKDVVAAILASPKFLYVSEETASNEARELNGYELATRLSFFLWSSIPDEELLATARDGSLTDPAVLDAQVTRMLEDPRCQSLSQNFARQWLRLDQLVTAVPDFDRFPEYYSRIGCEQWKLGLQTMIEPLLLFENIMVEDRSIMLLIDCNYSYRSDEVQSWYHDSVPFAGRENKNRFNTNQQQYRKRTLYDRRYGGVITSAATLTMTSSPLRTSPITRGAWVATVIFNDPPPPPPDVVPPIEADDKAIEAQGITLRQRLQQHQVNQSCKSCHAKIDPLGFALENFDAVGRWRDTYSSGLDIDASGELFGSNEFDNVIGMKDALLDHPEVFMRSFCEHMLPYALGRELELTDTRAVDNIVENVVADHGQFTTVVRQIAQSRPFRYHVPQVEKKASK